MPKAYTFESLYATVATHIQGDEARLMLDLPGQPLKPAVIDYARALTQSLKDKIRLANQEPTLATPEAKLQTLQLAIEELLKKQKTPLNDEAVGMLASDIAYEIKSVVVDKFDDLSAQLESKNTGGFLQLGKIYAPEILR